MNMMSPAAGGRRFPNYDISGLSVLVLERQTLMRNLMNQVFKEFKVDRLHITADQHEAFDLTCQIPVDLILSDWSHGLDGIEFLRKVRNDKMSRDPFVPVIVVTANTEFEHVCIARDAGMTEYLAKPVSAQMIYARICATIDNTRPFVRNRTFFGPDRRRKRKKPYTGPERRIRPE